MRPPTHVLAAVSMLVLAACGDDDAPTDGGTADAGRTAFAPDPPVLTPCPPGWVETTDASGIHVCEPWATPPPTECAVDEGVFPGEEGCVRVGTACPSGDFPEDLPTDARILYVLAGAKAGGNGRIDAPYASISSAFGTAFANTIVAIGKGTYDEIVRPPEGVTLWGACPAETVLTSTEPDARGGVIEHRNPNVTVRNLRIANASRNGILCRNECTMTVEDVIVDDVFTYGISVAFGSTLDARNVVVRNTRPDDFGEFGRGIGAESGAVVTLARVLSERNHEIGIAVFGEGSSLTADDVVARETLEQPIDDDFGRGVSVELGGSATLRRVVLERNKDVGLFVNVAPSHVVASDLVVRDTLSQAGRLDGGRGIAVQNGARAEIDRALFQRNRDVSLYSAAPDTLLVARDLVVLDSLPRESDLLGGGALDAEEGGRAEITRGHFARMYGISVIAFEATMALSHVTVEDVAPFACADTTCSEAALAVGIGSYFGSAIEASSFVVSASELCGVMLAFDAQLDLVRGEVRENQIGACLQVEGFDVMRLTREVAFVDNVTNLETTSLPEPEPLGAL
jgi:hypothetical protein